MENSDYENLTNPNNSKKFEKSIDIQFEICNEAKKSEKLTEI